MRSALFAIMALGIVGLALELLLLEHFDDWKQWIPLALFGVGLAVMGWHAVAPGHRSVQCIRAVMLVFVGVGAVGVYLHYRGNVEFELEMEPALAGWALFKAAAMGATPALAPGAMVQLGLIGLVWGWRHPALGITARNGTSTTERTT